MILIIESGATKADWCAVADDGIPVFIKTGGINLATMSEEVNEKTVNQALAELEAKDLREKVDRIHFYAAGLVSSEGDEVPELARGLDKVLKAHFPDAVIEYASDLLAAARAVCGHKPGIAAILGTGSNSCLYDGERIVKNIRSGGFILGDEGGGARLGKLFMSDFLKGLVHLLGDWLFLVAFQGHTRFLLWYNRHPACFPGQKPDCRTCSCIRDDGRKRCSR